MPLGTSLSGTGQNRQTEHTAESLAWRSHVRYARLDATGCFVSASGAFGRPPLPRRLARLAWTCGRHRESSEEGHQEHSLAVIPPLCSLLDEPQAWRPLRRPRISSDLCPAQILESRWGRQLIRAIHTSPVKPCDS